MKEECQVLLTTGRKDVCVSADMLRAQPSLRADTEGTRESELGKPPIPKALAGVLYRRGICSKAECAAFAKVRL